MSLYKLIGDGGFLSFRVIEAREHDKKVFDEALEYFLVNPLEKVFTSYSTTTSGIMIYSQEIYIIFSEDSRNFISRDKKALENFCKEISFHLEYDGKTYILKNNQVLEASPEQSLALSAAISKINGYSSFEELSSLNDVLRQYTIELYSDPEYTELFNFIPIDEDDDEDDEDNEDGKMYISRNLKELEKFARR